MCFPRTVRRSYFHFPTLLPRFSRHLFFVHSFSFTVQSLFVLLQVDLRMADFSEAQSIASAQPSQVAQAVMVRKSCRLPTV
jgi:hypothetical protein